MQLQRVISRALVASLIATLAVPACAALRMTVAVQTTNKADAGGTMQPDSAEQSDLVLADSYISSRTANTTQVFDFAQRRSEVLDETAKTYDAYSLYAVVGFRELEMRNREGMRKGLVAAKLEGKASTRLEDEHELSIAGALASPVAAHDDGADEVFASGDITLLRHSKDGTPVSASDAAHFVQFLRYQFGGHPAVLAALQNERRIPSRLVYTLHRPGGTQTVELTIGKVRQADAPAAPALAGYAPKLPPESASSLDDLLNRAWVSRATLATQAMRPAATPSVIRTSEAYPLEAQLALSERQFSDGRMPAFTDEQKHMIQSDPAIQALSRAVAAKDPDSLRQAVNTLRMLRLQAGSRRYLLSLFEANDLALLGEPARARALYAEVLQGNPALAGVYKDIGDFYYRNFDTAHAWRSWDIARTLAPLYPTVGAVTQFERSLATRFPAYFQGMASGLPDAN